MLLSAVAMNNSVRRRRSGYCAYFPSNETNWNQQQNRIDIRHKKFRIKHWNIQFVAFFDFEIDGLDGCPQSGRDH